MLSLLAIFLFFSYFILKEKKSQQETITGISQLELEIGELENKNFELAEMIKYLKSDKFVEFEARQKLGFQKPGEKVVIVPDTNGMVAGANIKSEQGLPNYIKWIKYFFE